MMAGMLVLSIISGAAGTALALAMSKPFWVALIAYPTVGMATIIAFALLLALRGAANKAWARSPAPLQAGQQH